MGNNSENIYADFFRLFEFTTPNHFSTKHILDIIIIVYPLVNYFKVKEYYALNYFIFDVFSWVKNVVDRMVFLLENEEF